MTAAVVLAGSLAVADAEAALVNPLDARGAAPSAQPPPVHVAASGTPHAAAGIPGVPPATAGQPLGHGRRAEREAKRAARKLQRQMRKQDQQGTSQQATPPPDAH